MSQRVVVLGGGPAGDVAALRAAQLGAEVTMIERAELGGTCLNWGCIPTKSLLAGADLLRKIRDAASFGIRVPEPEIDFPRMMERKEEIVLTMRKGVEAACKRKGVKVVRAQGVVDGDAVVTGDERHEFDHLIVCTGTEPAGLAGIDMEHHRVVTSNGILRLERIPEHMLVIGGGVVGCEFASLFAALGSRVTVVEVLPQVLAGVDPRVVQQWRRIVEKQGITFLPGAASNRSTTAQNRSRHTSMTAPPSKRISCSSQSAAAHKLAASVSRSAGVVINDRDHIEVDEYLRTANPKIWAAGDCIGGLQLAHLGSAEGGRAVENALGHERAADGPNRRPLLHLHASGNCHGWPQPRSRRKPQASS